MTDDDILRAAIECQLLTTGNREGFYSEALIFFAKLVAAQEREACAKICEPQEQHDDPLTAWKIAVAIRARSNT
jgi:hypothetical protein